MIVLQLERFGIRLTPEQKMLKEQIGRRTADSVHHPAPMSPTLGDSSFLAPNLKHMASPFDISPKSLYQVYLFKAWAKIKTYLDEQRRKGQPDGFSVGA